MVKQRRCSDGGDGCGFVLLGHRRVTQHGGEVGDSGKSNRGTAGDITVGVVEGSGAGTDVDVLNGDVCVLGAVNCVEL